MKKVVFPFFFFLLCCYAAVAQIYVEGVKLTPGNTGQYIEIDPQFRTDGRCTFTVDYGQANPKEDFVTDEYGKHFDFRSLVDGLNTFYVEGWEVAQITVVGNGRRFLLKRRY
jgi:hypothetical protein